MPRCFGGVTRLGTSVSKRLPALHAFSLVGAGQPVARRVPRGHQRRAREAREGGPVREEGGTLSSGEADVLRCVAAGEQRRRRRRRLSTRHLPDLGVCVVSDTNPADGRAVLRRQLAPGARPPAVTGSSGDPRATARHTHHLMGASHEKHPPPGRHPRVPHRRSHHVHERDGADDIVVVDRLSGNRGGAGWFSIGSSWRRAASRLLPRPEHLVLALLVGSTVGLTAVPGLDRSTDLDPGVSDERNGVAAARLRAAHDDVTPRAARSPEWVSHGAERREAAASRRRGIPGSNQDASREDASSSSSSFSSFASGGGAEGSNPGGVADWFAAHAEFDRREPVHAGIDASPPPSGADKEADGGTERNRPTTLVPNHDPVVLPTPTPSSTPSPARFSTSPPTPPPTGASVTAADTSAEEDVRAAGIGDPVGDTRWRHSSDALFPPLPSPPPIAAAHLAEMPSFDAGLALKALSTFGTGGDGVVVVTSRKEKGGPKHPTVTSSETSVADTSADVLLPKKTTVASLIGVSLGADGSVVGADAPPEDEDEERSFVGGGDVVHSSDDTSVYAPDDDDAAETSGAACDRVSTLRPGFYAQTDGDTVPAGRAAIAPGMAAACLNTTLRLGAAARDGGGREVVARLCAHGAAHHAALRAAVRASSDVFRVVVEAIDGAAWAEAAAEVAAASKKRSTRRSSDGNGNRLPGDDSLGMDPSLGPAVVEVGSRDGLVALFASRAGAAKVLAVPADPASASRQAIAAALNAPLTGIGAGRSGAHAALEVYGGDAAAGVYASPGDAVVRAVRAAARGRAGPGIEPRRRRTIAFVSLGGDGEADGAALLAAAHELFADAAAGIDGAPRVLNVGIHVDPSRTSTNRDRARGGWYRRRRTCASDIAAAVWRSVQRFGFDARVLRSPATDRASLAYAATLKHDADARAAIARDGLVRSGAFLRLRTEGDVRAVVAAAGRCGCPAYVWLATPDPSAPPIDRHRSAKAAAALGGRRPGRKGQRGKRPRELDVDALRELDALQETLAAHEARRRQTVGGGLTLGQTAGGSTARIVYNKTEIDEAAAALRAARATLRRRVEREAEGAMDAEEDAGGRGEGSSAEDADERTERAMDEEQSAALLKSMRARVQAILTVSGARDAEEAEDAAVEDLVDDGATLGRREEDEKETQEEEEDRFSGVDPEEDEREPREEEEEEEEEDRSTPSRAGEDVGGNVGGEETASGENTGASGDAGDSAAAYLRAAMVRHGYIDADTAAAVSDVASSTLAARLRESARRAEEEEAAEAERARAERARVREERARSAREEAARLRLARGEGKERRRSPTPKSSTLATSDERRAARREGVDGIEGKAPGPSGDSRGAEKTATGSDLGWGMGSASDVTVKTWDDVRREERLASKAERRERQAERDRQKGLPEHLIGLSSAEKARVLRSRFKVRDDWVAGTVGRDAVRERFGKVFDVHAVAPVEDVVSKEKRSPGGDAGNRTDANGGGEADAYASPGRAETEDDALERVIAESLDAYQRAESIDSIHPATTMSDAASAGTHEEGRAAASYGMDGIVQSGANQVARRDAAGTVPLSPGGNRRGSGEAETRETNVAAVGLPVETSSEKTAKERARRRAERVADQRLERERETDRQRTNTPGGGGGGESKTPRRDEMRKAVAGGADSSETFGEAAAFAGVDPTLDGFESEDDQQRAGFGTGE